MQVFVFLLQPVTQRRHFVQRLAQLAFAFLAFGDVAKDDHRPGEYLLIVDRCRNIFDTDRLAVLSPEHLVFDPVDLFKAERSVDRALLRRVDFAVQVVVVDHRMDVFAQ